MAFLLKKEPIVTEDIELSLAATVTQDRGVGTPFNAFKLPYQTLLTVGGALDGMYTKAAAIAKFALNGGDANVAFKVFPAINGNEAVSLDQLTSTVSDELADKANRVDVLELDNATAFSPINDYNPATKKYIDDAISTKFTDATSGTFTSADGKTITVVGGLITGII